MTALFSRNATDRSATTWRKQLEPWHQTDFLLADGAKGIARAVKDLAATRRKNPLGVPLEQGLDLFHTVRDAQRLLRRQWQKAEAAWQTAEAADEGLRRVRREGQYAMQASRKAYSAWKRASRLLEQASAGDRTWALARSAFEVFDERGNLNTRSRAEAILARALPGLAEAAWRKVRNALTDRRGLHFLDRLHRQLEVVEPRADWRAALAWRWWLGRGARGGGEAPGVLARCQGRHAALSELEAESFARVAAVLDRTCRASSAVECLNSVLRMHQSRHRRMTQRMLDLKRLYWNCHRFEVGPRRGRSPYEVLGVRLPTLEFWQLLQASPHDLTQTLSTP